LRKPHEHSSQGPSCGLLGHLRSFSPKMCQIGNTSDAGLVSRGPTRRQAMSAGIVPSTALLLKMKTGARGMAPKWLRFPKGPLLKRIDVRSDIYRHRHRFSGGNLGRRTALDEPSL